MSVRRLPYLLASMTLMSAALIVAQEPGSGLAPGAAVPGTFRSFIVSDERTDAKNPRNRTNKMHDLVTENGLYPVVAIFSRTTPATPDAPVANLARGLDSLVNKYRADRLGGFAVFLTLTKPYPEDDQRDARAKAVKDLSAQLKLQGVPMSVAAGEGEQIAKWGIADGHDLTIVMYQQLQVKHLWTFAPDKPPTEEEIKTILDTIDQELQKSKKK